MANLYVPGGNAAWRILPLSADLNKLTPQGPEPLSDPEPDNLMLVRTRNACNHESWTLIVPPRRKVRVNGVRAPVGMHLMTDRDVIALGEGCTLWFSTETLAQVAPYAGEPGGSCARCRLPLEPGTPAVRCPAASCGVWYHEDEISSPCWTYSERCPVCGHPTAFDTGYQWSPADL